MFGNLLAAVSGALFFNSVYWLLSNTKAVQANMFRHITHKQVDRLQWDSLITRVPNGLIYALSWYLDIVSPGWEALVKEINGRYVAVLPLPVRTKFGLRYLKQPSFAQQLGLFYTELPTAADWQEISRQLQQRFRFVSTYAFNTSNVELLTDEQSAMSGRCVATYHLSLRPAFSQLLATYKTKRRWELKRAQCQALTLAPTTDIEKLVRLFTENTAGKIYGIIGEAYEYRMLRALYAAASQAGMATMWQATIASSEVVAMILLFQFKGQFTYIFSSATKAGKQAGAVTLLLSEVFRTYAGQDICFDFGASEILGAPEVASLAHYYSSFGSVRVLFPTISYNRLPWPLKQVKAARMVIYRHLRPRSSN